MKATSPFGPSLFEGLSPFYYIFFFCFFVDSRFSLPTSACLGDWLRWSEFFASGICCPSRWLLQVTTHTDVFLPETSRVCFELPSYSAQAFSTVTLHVERMSDLVPPFFVLFWRSSFFPSRSTLLTTSSGDSIFISHVTSLECLARPSRRDTVFFAPGVHLLPCVAGSHSRGLHFAQRPKQYRGVSLLSGTGIVSLAEHFLFFSPFSLSPALLCHARQGRFVFCSLLYAPHSSQHFLLLLVPPHHVCVSLTLQHDFQLFFFFFFPRLLLSPPPH